MNVIRFTELDLDSRLRKLAGMWSLFDKVIEDRTGAIVEGVYLRGDAAMLEFSERFDGRTLTAERLPVSVSEFVHASLKADGALRRAVDAAGRNIEMFSRKSLRKNWSALNQERGRVGEKFDPFQRVGIYVPGGTAPLVSTALMTVTLARVAGCSGIADFQPCGKDGAINAALLFAIRTAGATEGYRLGGAQAIAAMAY